jgi:hypothetical protein
MQTSCKILFFSCDYVHSSDCFRLLHVTPDKLQRLNFVPLFCQLGESAKKLIICYPLTSVFLIFFLQQIYYFICESED